MTVAPYRWPKHSDFINRTADLERLETWWGHAERPLSVYGRRRVGKSWLLRAFAHGKPALFFVADSVAEAPQLERFRRTLAEVSDIPPAVDDLPSFFRVLFRLARNQKLLVVIDEFPYLLPTRETPRREMLQRIQAVFEQERDESQLQLILCGSHLAVMESLHLERSPLHGRLVPLLIAPLRFGDAKAFLTESRPQAMVEKYAVAGGMPLYLNEVRSTSLRQSVCQSILNPRGPLFDEPRTLLSQELREMKFYLSILEQLGTGNKTNGELTTVLSTPDSGLTDYLETLRNLRLVDRRIPITQTSTSRDSHYQLIDPFLRFWFRFVFPYQADLAAGTDPAGHFDGIIKPRLADHVALTFEEICTDWVRVNHAECAQRYGPWWGKSLNVLRRKGVRSSEEIDIVGLSGKRVTLVGECRWRSGAIGMELLDALLEFKLPALRQSGATLARDLRILLLSKSGFSAPLKARAKADDRIELLDLETIVAGTPTDLMPGTNAIAKMRGAGDVNLSTDEILGLT